MKTGFAAVCASSPPCQRLRRNRHAVGSVEQLCAVASGPLADKDHWEGVYGRKGADEVSWFRPHLERSLSFIENASVARDAAIIDVGGGASTLRRRSPGARLSIGAAEVDRANQHLRAGLVDEMHVA